METKELVVVRCKVRSRSGDQSTLYVPMSTVNPIVPPPGPHVVPCVGFTQAMYKEFMSAVEDANIVNLRYPTGYSEDFDVHQDRAAVLYLVSGWVLSSAFAHVRRNIHDRLVFSPLLKAQKYADKNDFDRRAPESMRGVEKEVLRRSELEGKSLILVSSGFFTLVQRWEAGYRHAFSSPYLLATYMGNLPNEIKSVVGRAEAVELQWKRCVGATPEWFSNPSVEQSLYEILLDKYHILRFAEYCRRLVMASEPPKMDKAKQQAIHATLKARAGAKPEPQQANEGAGAASDRTAEDIARAKADLVALKLTRVSFNQLSVAQLRHHIENVGGRINGHIYATKTHLEMQLKYLVPGIISSEEEDEDLEDCDVRTATAVEALGGVYVESEW